MNAAARILLIEDDSGITDTLQRVLAAEGHEVAIEKRGDGGLARAIKDSFNLVITDLKLPGLNGLELVRQLHTAKPRLPIILVTAFGTTETAIEAMKVGAYDYLLKPFNIPQLIELVHKAADSNRRMSEPVGLGEAGQSRDALVGRSQAMQDIYKEIGRVASKPVTVLIRGAFTGADARRIGRFEQADHGTIFLDEIGDMTPGTQIKLLRVLQEKTLQRLGGKETIPVDVRVVAATHRDLETAIREKQFREDLYYRLNVVAITLPPLRNRREDIPDLVRYFLGKHGPDLGNASPSIHSEAVEFLQSQSWPGNVRELENVMRKALLAAQGYTINLDHVRTALNKNSGELYSAMRSFGEYVDELLAAARREEITDTYARVLETAERELFARAIQQARGNQAKAARWLGISRITMKAKLVQFGLHPGQDADQEP
jgi:DNA-binding NtrC family response regulator